jgi:hypothetical protein
LALGVFLPPPPFFSPPPAADASAALVRQASIHDRMIERSRGPDGSRRSHIMAYADEAGATEAHALFGPPQEIVAGLHALHTVGVRYVLINATRPSMQRFAAEVMPAFAQDNSAFAQDN